MLAQPHLLAPPLPAPAAPLLAAAAAFATVPAPAVHPAVSELSVAKAEILQLQAELTRLQALQASFIEIAREDGGGQSALFQFGGPSMRPGQTFFGRATNISICLEIKPLSL